jgi:hypothetical protein
MTKEPDDVFISLLQRAAASQKAKLLPPNTT